MLLSIFLISFFSLVVTVMAVIYATLIIKGKKTFAEVPAVLKDKVKEILIDLELPELAE